MPQNDNISHLYVKIYMSNKCIMLCLGLGLPRLNKLVVWGGCSVFPSLDYATAVKGKDFALPTAALDLLWLVLEQGKTLLFSVRAVCRLGKMAWKIPSGRRADKKRATNIVTLCLC